MTHASDTSRRPVNVGELRAFYLDSTATKSLACWPLFYKVFICTTGSFLLLYAMDNKNRLTLMVLETQDPFTWNVVFLVLLWTRKTIGWLEAAETK